MEKVKPSGVKDVAPQHSIQGRSRRMVISGIILAVFWGALLSDYWPSLAPGVLRIYNSARSAGAKATENPYFMVKNNSKASESELASIISAMEQQYRMIQKYTVSQPEGKLQVLIVDGSGPAMIDGAQMVLNYDNGVVDTDLVPLYLALLIQEIPIDLAGEITPAGGEALHVVEASGLGDELIHQPLNAWVVLIRQSSAYIPLEDAWKAPLPNNEEGYYFLLRAVLESGSFMGWFIQQHGLEAAQRVARGEPVETVSGRTLGENEKEWLQWLDQQDIQPTACHEVLPDESIFSLLCVKLQETSK